MQDTKIGKCYQRERGTSFALFHLCQSHPLSGGMGGKATRFQTLLGVFLFEACVLTWMSAGVYLGLFTNILQRFVGSCGFQV